MDKRISVGKRVADDILAKKGLDALFDVTPVQQYNSERTRAKRFEKGTFYFEPEDLARLERVWLELMSRGIRCNKSEIVSVLLRSGLDEHEKDPEVSSLVQRLTGKRRRA